MAKEGDGVRQWHVEAGTVRRMGAQEHTVAQRDEEGTGAECCAGRKRRRRRGSQEWEEDCRGGLSRRVYRRGGSDEVYEGARGRGEAGVPPEVVLGERGSYAGDFAGGAGAGVRSCPIMCKRPLKTS